jgi:hypothetical protein
MFKSIKRLLVAASVLPHRLRRSGSGRRLRARTPVRMMCVCAYRGVC